MAVVREEPPGGPLASALERRGLIPVACPVLIAGPPTDPGPLLAAAARLAEYDWVVCASARAVAALGQVREEPWPARTRAAAVGIATAAALEALGVPHPPLVAEEAGAGALWTTLATQDRWPGRRVLALTTPGGRTTLTDGLRAAGAQVDAVESYRMQPRAAADIRRDWATADPDALAIGSPRAVTTLIEAIGLEPVSRLAATVAIGGTTAAALLECGISPHRAAEASFESVAEMVAQLYEAGADHRRTPMASRGRP